MADETIDKQAADAEAAAEAQTVADQNDEAAKVVEERRAARHAADEENPTPRFPNTVLVGEDDFPSVEDEHVNLLQSEAVDPNEGWTAQSEVGFVSRESLPGQYVQPHELPTKEGLRAMSIDPVSYVAGVPVRKA